MRIRCFQYIDFEEIREKYERIVVSLRSLNADGKEEMHKKF